MPLPDISSFSIEAPAYNQEDAIRQTITEPNQIGDQAGMTAEMTCEIIPANDGPHGRTRELPDQTGRPEPIQVIHHHPNRGHGASLKTGVKASKHPMVVIPDADGAYPTGRIAEFAAVSAKRQIGMPPGAGTCDEVHTPQKRRFANGL